MQLPSPGEILAIAFTIILVLGGTLRLTRFITSDTLGGWLIRDRALLWGKQRETSYRTAVLQVLERLYSERDSLTPAAARMLNKLEGQLGEDEPMSPAMRLVSGLYCPFCVGFWVGFAMILLTLGVIVLSVTWLSIAWYVALGALTLNYIAGHISARLD